MNDALKMIQSGLAAMGHDPGPQDGLWGAKTEAAVEALLQSDGRPAAPPSAASTMNARSQRNLVGVHPDLVRVMTRALAYSPIPFTVIEGLRTVERQRQLVAQGASKTMNSRHITGHAVDIVPHRPDGKLAFDWPLYHKVAPVIKAAAADLGVAIEWGGDWRTFKDGPHFELSRSVYP
jgi:peptidoglycan LD-endopeptidase CwlK